MFKKLLISSAILLSATAAQADDLTTTNLAPTSIGNWGGLYAGIQSGIATSDSNITVDTEGTGSKATLQQELAGGFIGYDHVTNNLVVGVVADMNGRFGSDMSNFDGNALESGWRTSSDWNASIRARLGIATEQALFYTTAGIAFANYKFDNPDCGPCAEWNGDNLLGGTRTGWAAGAGVEVKLNENWRARLEYLHADYGNHESSYNVTSYDSEITSNAFQLGLVYQFE
jgi:outer membrane immunogenic protein